MKVANAAGIELTAQLRRDGRGDQLAGGRQVVEALEEVIEPFGDARPARVCEPAGGGDVRDRQDSRHDLGVDAGCRRIIPEAEETVR